MLVGLLGFKPEICQMLLPSVEVLTIHELIYSACIGEGEANDELSHHADDQRKLFHLARVDVMQH